jgi:hypothetical protein
MRWSMRVMGKKKGKRKRKEKVKVKVKKEMEMEMIMKADINRKTMMIICSIDEYDLI